MADIVMSQEEVNTIFNKDKWEIHRDEKGYFVFCSVRHGVHLYFLSNGKFWLSNYGQTIPGKSLIELGLNLNDKFYEEYSLYYHKEKENIIPFLNQCLKQKIFKKEDLNLLGDLNEQYTIGSI